MIQLKLNAKLILTHNCVGWLYLTDILIYGHF
jgi:hypothetical protein